jgi:hypothetical protein
MQSISQNIVARIIVRCYPKKSISYYGFRFAMTKRKNTTADKRSFQVDFIARRTNFTVQQHIIEEDKVSVMG